MSILSNTDSVLSVSDVNRKAKHLLETNLKHIHVEAELSSFTEYTSGHWYFSLKDSKAQMNCVMFKTYQQRLKWKPSIGDQLRVRGSISLYETRGNYQMIVEYMQHTGSGALQLAFEHLKKNFNLKVCLIKREKKYCLYGQIILLLLLHLKVQPLQILSVFVNVDFPY